MSRAQGALEYLVIIATALAITAVVTSLVITYFAPQQNIYYYSSCRQAASSCKTTQYADTNDACAVCNSACNYSNGTEIFPGAIKCCRFGNSTSIYEGSSGCTGCFADTDCTSTPLTPHCYNSTRTCVECAKDSDCLLNPNGHTCSASTHTCISACRLDSDCTGLQPPGQLCCSHLCKKIYNTLADCTAGVDMWCMRAGYSASISNEGTCDSSCSVPLKAEGTNVALFSSSTCSADGCIVYVTNNVYICNALGGRVYSGQSTYAWACAADTKCESGKSRCEVAQGYCGGTAIPVCGNNVIESSEQCDDGNTANGDSCNSTCQNEVAPVCGNGVKEGSEQCDGTALGSCQYGCTNQCTCAPYCGDGITNGNEDCDGTATGTSCDGKCREECACPKQLYLVKINDGGSAALFSNTFTQITSTAYNFRQAIVKTAIVSNGGDTEIIVLNNSHDSWYNPQQLLFIKKDANGNLVTDKELILINGYFVDFAIMDWNGDGWPDLVLLQYTNTVLIYSDISSLSDGSTFNTGQATWVLNLDGDTNHKYSMIKAAYVNGAPTLVAMRVGADGRGRRDFIRYSWDWECKGVTYPAGSASTTAHTKYFNFILPADRVCADFDFIDWNNNKKTEIALMTRKVSTTTGTYWHAQNSVFIYDISKLPNDGSNVNLQFADDTTKTYTWIDAGNLNAGDFWVEDFNGDGKDEFMVAAGEGDIYQYSNSGNTALGTSIPDSTNIRTVVAPTGTFNSGTSTDMAPIDWGYLRIPKIA